MKDFYFTNPFRQRHKGRELQLSIEKELEGIIKLNNPFYRHSGEPKTEEVRLADAGEKVEEIHRNGLVSREKKEIIESAGVVAWFTDMTGPGSIQECYMSYEQYGKPTYIICDPKSRNYINNPKHPWLLEHSSRIFGTKEGFIEYMKEKYGNKKEIQNADKS